MLTRNSITGELAAFVSESAVPAEAREVATAHVLDTLGVLLAGCAEPVVGHVVAELTAGQGSSTFLGLARSGSPTEAALVNAVSAHVIDYDDVHSHVRGHPSACVLPAALALCEDADGATLLDAYVVGIEVAGRVGRSFDSSHARQGFHSTSTLGVMGAAAAASRALQLDAEQVAHALGIAASTASGLRANFGTMTKPLHAGFAARDGVTAALLARRGVTATDSVLDGTEAFARVFCPDGGDPSASRRPGDPWEILDPGIAIKKYPCCNRGHRAVDAVLGLVRDHDIDASDVTGVEVRMPAGQVEDGRVGPMTFPRPTSGLEAKFSMQYVVAAAIRHRSLPVAAFTDDGMQDPQIRPLLDLVHPVNRADDGDFVEVVVTTRRGVRHSRTVRVSRGDPRGGGRLPWNEVETKYRDCASTVLDEKAIDSSVELVRTLEAVPDVRELTGALAGPGAC